MYTLVANFLGYATENYRNWIIFSQDFAKVKRVTFFETQCRRMWYIALTVHWVTRLPVCRRWTKC